MTRETIFSDREAMRKRDVEKLVRDFNVSYDDPIVEALFVAWDYGYMEAIMRETVSHEAHESN